MKCIARLGMVFLLTHGTAVYAEPVLLASRQVGGIHGSQEIYGSRWPALVYLGEANEIIAPLFEDFSLAPDFPVNINDTIFANSDSDFEIFADRLTDGLDQTLLVLSWDELGPHGGGGGFESSNLMFFVPRLGPDLVGYTVDHITQILTVDIQSPGSDPFGDGMWSDWSVIGRYDFYGSVIPEPATLYLLTMCSGMSIMAGKTTIRRLVR